MDTRRRNIILAVVGVLLLLCCCCMLLAGASLLYLVPWDANGPSVNPQPERRVIVITPQGAPRAAATVRPAATSQPGSLPATVAPGTPAPAMPMTTTLQGDDSQVLEAKANMPMRDLRDLALRLKPSVTDIPTVVNPTPPVYKVGDKAQFWVENSDNQEHTQITAVLRYVTDHVYMWVEEGVELDEGDLKRSADRFETNTYPTNREFFGSEWTPGVDNDVHLSILHSRGLGSNVAGYYSSADQFSKLVNQYSNEREMFYIAADNAPGKPEPNTAFYDGVLAHEFQHMIHWANDRNEDSWVNEGMSELAGTLNGFDTGGVEFAYAEKPDTQLTTWSDINQGNSEHYGASYLFTNYFLGRFGEDVTKAVVASDENGAAGFTQALSQAGRAETFDDVFGDWVIANYLDQPDAAPQGHFGYADIDPPQPVMQDVVRRYPKEETTDVSQYGADYVQLDGAGNLSIDFSGQTEVSLVDTEPRGSFAWWSHRGDDSDMTLTRPFDLRNLSAATLTFSAWYDIEEGYDYAYVEVSTDGGQRWEILPGLHTTTENPVGNAFGPGWTGISGGGSAPEWVDERIDLTSYAGKDILLRFEYVTDDAVNGPGLLLDDIRIAELNYQDGGEDGSAGWQAAGWVLTDNTLEQRWLVQLVTVDGNDMQVQRMAVGPDGKGHFDLSGVGNLDEAILVISALAPVTTEKATYSYNISIAP